MGPSKLKSIHVVIIGSVACILIVVGLYFLFVKNANARIAALNVRYTQADSVYQTLNSVESNLATTNQKFNLVKSKNDRYMREYMPPLSCTDRAQGMLQRWNEQAKILGPMIKAWPSKYGVTLTSSVSVPAPPVNPNNIDNSMITLPMGTFSVTGDFRSIMAHIRSWNKFHRLVQIDAVSLDGQSPNITAQYNVTVYIFPQGEPGPTIEMAGGGQAAASGPGGLAGMPGGMSMPGAMPGRSGMSGSGSMPSRPGAGAMPPGMSGSGSMPSRPGAGAMPPGMGGSGSMPSRPGAAGPMPYGPSASRK